MLFALLPLDQAFPEKHIHIRQLDSTAVGAGQPSCWTRGGEAVLDEQNIVMKETGCESYSDLRAVSCPSPCLHGELKIICGMWLGTAWMPSDTRHGPTTWMDAWHELRGSYLL